MGRVINILMLLWLISLGLTFCNLPRLYKPQYSHEYNEERKKLGLPIIPDGWILSGVSQEHAIWQDPEREKKLENRIPFHESKQVDYKSGNLRWEEDVYYGLEDYLDANGDLQREYLVITYYYQVSEDDTQTRWKAVLVQGWRKEGGLLQGGEVTLEEAEKILVEWGIKRLNYDFSSKD